MCKNFGKTAFIKDCRQGLQLCLQITEKQAFTPVYKKVTKVTSSAIYFGKRELKLPDAKHLMYSGLELLFLDDEGKPIKKYSVRKERK